MGNKPTREHSQPLPTNNRQHARSSTKVTEDNVNADNSSSKNNHHAVTTTTSYQSTSSSRRALEGQQGANSSSLEINASSGQANHRPSTTSSTQSNTTSPVAASSAPNSRQTMPSSLDPFNQLLALFGNSSQHSGSQGNIDQNSSSIRSNRATSTSMSSSHLLDFTNAFNRHFSTSAQPTLIERNGTMCALINKRLFPIPRPQKCEFCNKMISAMEEDFDIHRVKCMTKPRIASQPFEVNDTHTDLLEEECTICFDEFQIGQVCSRLECFCVYHKSCLESWLSRKQCCPLHMSDTFTSGGPEASSGTG